VLLDAFSPVLVVYTSFYITSDKSNIFRNVLAVAGPATTIISMKFINRFTIILLAASRFIL